MCEMRRAIATMVVVLRCQMVNSERIGSVKKIKIRFRIKGRWEFSGVRSCWLVTQKFDHFSMASKFLTCLISSHHTSTQVVRWLAVSELMTRLVPASSQAHVAEKCYQWFQQYNQTNRIATRREMWEEIKQSCGDLSTFPTYPFSAILQEPLLSSSFFDVDQLDSLLYGYLLEQENAFFATGVNPFLHKTTQKHLDAVQQARDSLFRMLKKLKSDAKFLQHIHAHHCCWAYNSAIHLLRERLPADLADAPLFLFPAQVEASQKIGPFDPISNLSSYSLKQLEIQPCPGHAARFLFRVKGEHSSVTRSVLKTETKVPIPDPVSDSIPTSADFAMSVSSGTNSSLPTLPVTQDLSLFSSPVSSSSFSSSSSSSAYSSSSDVAPSLKAEVKQDSNPELTSLPSWGDLASIMPAPLSPVGFATPYLSNGMSHFAGYESSNYGGSLSPHNLFGDATVPFGDTSFASNGVFNM